MSSQTVIWKTTAYFNATAHDSEDALRFTWVWGDGTISVTTSPKLVTHSYSQKQTYDLRVYADDLTGLAGHNVSALDVVSSIAGHSNPLVETLTVNRTWIWITKSVTFTAQARDPTGDGMRFTINCGDGKFVIVDMPSTANNVLVTATAVHTYTSSGSMAAYLWVTDGLDNTTLTSPATVSVLSNNPPVVNVPPPNRKVWAGNSTSFSVTATDPDNATLRFTWDFGDGSALVVRTTGGSVPHTYTKAGTFTCRVFVSDLTGIVGHNVSSTSTATIGFNLPLVAGWNFVSVPLVGYGYKASTIGLASGDQISLWNSTWQSFNKTYTVGSSPSTDDFAINASTGYWIYSLYASETLHVYGSVPTTTQVVTCTVPFGGGWVAVGIESMKLTMHGSDVLWMYSGVGAVSQVARYNAASGTFSSYVTAIQITDYLMAPGQACWCWVTASGTLTYTP